MAKRASTPPLNECALRVQLTVSAYVYKRRGLVDVALEKRAGASPRDREGLSGEQTQIRLRAQLRKDRKTVTSGKTPAHPLPISDLLNEPMLLVPVRRIPKRASFSKRRRQRGSEVQVSTCGRRTNTSGTGTARRRTGCRTSCVRSSSSVDLVVRAEVVVDFEVDLLAVHWLAETETVVCAGPRQTQRWPPC